VRVLYQNQDLISHTSSEIFEGSQITISARSRFIPFGKFEALVKVGGEEAMKAFWDSKKSLSCM
jgi:hypothetical protein